MKYYIAAGFACVIAAGAFFYFKHNSGTPQQQWKRAAVEKETTTRPAYFEAMKYDPAVVRTPASQSK